MFHFNRHQPRKRMLTMEFKTKTLAQLRTRVERGEPRRNLKRLLRDNGGTGSAEELTAALDSDAYKSTAVINQAKKLAAHDAMKRTAIENGSSEALAIILADLRTEIKHQGLTLAEVADRVEGLHQSNLSAWFAGKRPPMAISLVSVAAAIGMRLKLTRETRPDERRENDQRR